MAASLVAVGPVVPARGAAADGPVNLGFEEGVLGGHPSGWLVGPDTDGVTVVDEETGTDSPTYASTNTVVSPYNGTRMLRLGTPKDVAETQSTGPTTVTQQFDVPDGASVVVAARVFSWEFRDIDRVAFRADGAYLAAPATFFADTAWAETCDRSAASKVKGTAVYPAAWACEISIAGTKGDLLDSDWQVLHLTARPDTDADPDTITLSYTVEGTGNSSHATWAYLDDVNRPPVAQFTSEPPLGSLVYEGSLVQLRDTSYDPDRPDDVVAWDWTVTAPATVLLDNVLESTAAEPSFFPPDEGNYTVDLTVTSSDGTKDAIDPVTIRVTNAPPLVNALDVDVLSGGQAPVQVRYVDPGWTDDHVAEIGGTTVAIDPDDVTSAPALQRGIARRTVAAPASGSEQILVSVDDVDDDALDEPGGALAPASTDQATIRVVAKDPQLNEPDGTIGEAAPVVADTSRLSFLGSSGDVDVVKLGLRGGPLLPGTEVLVALDEVPADLDLVVVARSASTAVAPYQMAPYQMAPYQMAPYQMAPYQMAPISAAPYQMAPYQMAPYQMAALGLSPYQMAPYQMAGVQPAPYQMAPYQMAPLSSDPGITAATATGGGDIDPAELGIEGLLRSSSGLQVAGFSANRGLERESVLVRVDQPGTELFAVVVGANGGYSATTPYRLRLESSATWNAVADAEGQAGTSSRWATLQDQFCAPVSHQPTFDPVARPVMPATEGRTLVVTNLDRLAASGDAATWPGFLDALQAYTRHELVQADLLDLQTDYGSWDDNPCQVDAANGVAEGIRGEIRARLAQGAYEYVVILGDDTVVPFRRTTTGVVVGDESQYLAGSFLKPGSPLAAALAASQELTDDYYTDLDPTPFQTGELYVPDVVTARMVETPADITGQMSAFVRPDVDGRLDATTALVTAHDFLADGGGAIATSLGARATVSSDLSDTWDADRLRCGWLGVGAGCEDTADIVSPNSHWTHYASLSAQGFATDQLGEEPGLADILTSEEVGTTPAASPQLVFTIGCHAGFSVPDDQSLDATAYGIDPALDFPQALARRQAVYVASTGFGLGDTEGLAGTEQLMADFAEELVVNGRTAGQALLAAKRGYVDGLSTVSTYDVKSLIQQTLYGPPQYRVFRTTSAEALATALDAAATGITSTPNPDGTTTHRFGFTSMPTDASPRWWTVDDDVQITPGRPWQPRAVLPIAETTRGAVITTGRYRDVTGFEPMVTRPTVEWEQAAPELGATCRNSWWPADLTTVTDGGLVVVPGQFRCTGTAPDGSTRGTQRLYDELTVELTGSTSADRTPPRAGPLDIRSVDGQLELGFPASDASGIARIVPLVLHDGTISSVQAVAPSVQDGTYRVLVSAPPGAEIVVQVVDGAGNVTTLTGRGANLRHLPVTAPSPVLVTPGAETMFRATIPGFATAVAPVQYLWDFGDETTASGMVTGTDLVVPHTTADPLWTERTATLRVWDADGATGTVDVRVIRRCDRSGDAYGNGWADLVGCGVQVTGGVATFTVRLAEPVSAAGSYRVEITTGTGKKQVTTKLKYDHANASYSGTKSLVAGTADGGYAVVYRLDVADLARGQLAGLRWFAEVQSGISGVPTAGFVDRMPDVGALSWTPAG